MVHHALYMAAIFGNRQLWTLGIVVEMNGTHGRDYGLRCELPDEADVCVLKDAVGQI